MFGKKVPETFLGASDLALVQWPEFGQLLKVCSVAPELRELCPKLRRVALETRRAFRATPSTNCSFRIGQRKALEIQKCNWAFFLYPRGQAAACVSFCFPVPLFSVQTWNCLLRGVFPHVSLESNPCFLAVERSNGLFGAAVGPLFREWLKFRSLSQRICSHCQVLVHELKTPNWFVFVFFGKLEVICIFPLKRRPHDAPFWNSVLFAHDAIFVTQVDLRRPSAGRSGGASPAGSRRAGRAKPEIWANGAGHRLGCVGCLAGLPMCLCGGNLSWMAHIVTTSALSVLRVCTPPNKDALLWAVWSEHATREWVLPFCCFVCECTRTTHLERFYGFNGGDKLIWSPTCCLAR